MFSCKRLVFTGLLIFNFFVTNVGEVTAQNIFTNENFLPQRLRKQLEEKGISYEIVYTAEYFANTRGGLKRDDTYHTNLDLTFDIDTKKLGFWDNGQFFMYVLENSGGEKLTGSIVGDLQTVSNIEAPRTMRIYELWYQHSYLNDVLSLLLGFHDYNSEFNVTEYGGLYINSSFGIQPDISAGARPSIFPLAAPGVRLKITPNEQWELLLAVYDGDPGDPEESEHFPRSDFDSEGGAFIAGEVAYHFNNDYLPGFVKLGIWNNTGDFDDVSDLDGSGTPIKRSGNMGGYVLIDKQLYKEKDDQGLGGFIQFGANDKRVNEVNMYIGGGVNYKGLFPQRDDDEIGIAIAHARINDDIVGAGGRDDHETTIEATYSAQINDHIRIQPDIQYIFNPGAVNGTKDALVAGVRVEVSL